MVLINLFKIGKRSESANSSSASSSADSADMGSMADDTLIQPSIPLPRILSLGGSNSFSGSAPGPMKTEMEETKPPSLFQFNPASLMGMGNPQFNSAAAMMMGMGAGGFPQLMPHSTHFGMKQ